MATVLTIAFSDLKSDPRVDRQIRFLHGEHRVIAAGLGPPGVEGVDYIPLGEPPIPLARKAPRRIGAVALNAARRHERAYWQSPTLRRARERLRQVPADVVIANEVRSLPLAFTVPGARVVFDAHEYAPREREDERWWRLVEAPAIVDLCGRYIPRVAGMMTVGPAIADQYEKDTGVRPVVVTNAPDFVDLRPSPVESPIRLVHYGWADPGRRLETMLDMMRHLPERFTLDLLLKGPDGYLQELHRRAGDDPRIRFLPTVPMRELVRFANQYDIGVYLLDPGNFNRRNAMPNKFFEFVQARLAVAIGPSPEMAAVTTAHDLGVVAPDHSPEALAARLRELGPDDVMAFKRSSDRAARELSSEPNGERVRALVARAAATP